MYYKYTADSEIIMPLQLENVLLFKIVLKEKMPFKLGESYITIYKNHNYEFSYSDEISISFFSTNKSMIDAKKHIKESIEFLTYLTEIPYDTDIRISESESDSLPIISTDKSRVKMNKVININKLYVKIHSKKELMIQCMQLYASAIRLNLLSNYLGRDDAFFAFFKIIEIISKDEYSSESPKIQIDKLTLKSCIEEIYLTQFGIVTTQNKLDDIVGCISSTLMETTFEELFHKILFCAHKRNIEVDHELLHKIVKLRNASAHGESIEMATSDNEYGYTYSLSRKFINAKFFDSIPNIHLESKIEQK